MPLDFLALLDSSGLYELPEDTMPFPGFKLTDAYRFAASHGLEVEARTIRAMPIHPDINRNRRHVPRKGAFVELFEQKGVIEDFSQQDWTTRHTPAGERRRQVYVEAKRHNDRLWAGGADEDELGEAQENPGEDEPTNAELAAFVLEAQLRDFIIENISRITVGGRQVSLYRDAAGRDGKEYPTDVGPIDILAVDDRGNFFVFELKLDRGPDRALGQLARYMGWVKIHLAADHEVRGVIVARNIGERLRYAGCVMPTVMLLEYEIEFRLRDAGSISAP
jgi:endonuclease